MLRRFRYLVPHDIHQCGPVCHTAGSAEVQCQQCYKHRGAGPASRAAVAVRKRPRALAESFELLLPADDGCLLFEELFAVGQGLFGQGVGVARRFEDAVIADAAPGAAWQTFGWELLE